MAKKKLTRVSRTNWVEAFTYYCRGSSIEDIAAGLGVPAAEVQAQAALEDWFRMAKLFQDPVVGTVNVNVAVKNAEELSVRIQENRERNLVIAAKLQADLLEVVERLRDNSLVIERQSAKGVRYSTPAGIKDRVDLVNYAKGVAELSYRALGDAGPSVNSDRPPEAATVTVNIPMIVGAPREAREYLPKGDVIEVGAKHEKPAEMPAPAAAADPSNQLGEYTQLAGSGPVVDT